VVGPRDELGLGAVAEPHAAEDRDGQHVDRDLGQGVDDVVADIVAFGPGEFEHQQRHHDREDTVGEVAQPVAAVCAPVDGLAGHHAIIASWWDRSRRRINGLTPAAGRREDHGVAQCGRPR